MVKLENVQKLIKLFKKTRYSDLTFVFNSLNDNTKDLLSEVIFNIIYNAEGLHITPRSRAKLQRLISPHKKDFLYISRRASSKHKKRNQIMGNQVGSGLLTLVLGIVAPAIVSLISSAVK